MAIPNGTLGFPGLNVTPSPPVAGAYLLYAQTDNTLRMEDSSGNIYIFGSTGFIDTLTGDVTNGPVVSGSTAVTINYVGGQTAAAVAFAVTQVAAATSSNTASTLVLRDSSGNFSAGTITANLTGNISGSSSTFTGSLSGDVTGTQSATTILSTVVTGKLLTGYVTGTNTPITATNTILQSFENLQAQISASSGSAITALTGDVSATGPGSVTSTVNSVGGQSAVAIAYAATQVAAATSNNIASTLVLRDASGNLSANVITANLVGNVTGNVSGTASNITGTVAILNGGTGQTIAINAFNALSPMTTLGDIIYENSTPSAARLPGNTTNIREFLTSQGSGGLATAPSWSSLISSDIPNNAANTTGTALNITATTNSTLTTLTSLSLPGSQVTGNISGNATNVTGVVAIANGGTGQTTAAAAFNALTPMTTTGDIEYESAPGTASRLPIGTTGEILTVVSGIPAWVSPATSGTVTSVALADNSATPIYTITNSPVTSSGTLTFTLNTEAANTIFAGPTSGSAAQPTFRALVSADVPILNQNTTGTASNITATTNTTLITLSSLSLPGSQVTGNISGNAANVTGIVAIANGGTGQTTANAAFDALSPMTTLGDLIYENATPTAARLAGNTTTTREFLTSQGTGSIANAPSWNALVSGDIPNNAANTTGTASNITAITNLTLTSLPNLTSANSLSLIGSQIGGFTQGSVIFAGASGILSQDNANFYWNDSTLNLGLGTIPATNIALDIVNSSGTSKAIQTTSYGTGSSISFRGRFARGTILSPTAAQSGDNLSVLSGRGYGTSQFAAASTGAINIVAAETFTNTSNATYLQFEVTPTASVTLAEHMRVSATGVTLGPQSSSTDIHQINGGLNLTTKTITSSTYTVDTTTTDNIIYTDSTSNAITITLPAATNGRVIVIQDKTGQATTNHITVTPPGSVTINGVNASVLLGVNYGGWVFMSDGTNWTYYRLSQLPSVQALSSTVIDWSTVGIAGGIFTKTLSANTTFTFSNAIPGQTIVIRLTNTASNYTVTWPSMKWPVQTTPVMTIGAFSDVYTIIYDGTNYFGSYVQNF